MVGYGGSYWLWDSRYASLSWATWVGTPLILCFYVLSSFPAAWPQKIILQSIALRIYPLMPNFGEMTCGAPFQCVDIHLIQLCCCGCFICLLSVMPSVFQVLRFIFFQILDNNPFNFLPECQRSTWSTVMAMEVI